MAKSQEQLWLERYYGALVGLTVRKVEIVCDESAEWYGNTVEWWPTITLVADDGEEFVVEVSRDQEGNGAGFLFGLPIHRDTTGKLVCERCLNLIDPQDPSAFENLKALEVGAEEMVCVSCWKNHHDDYFDPFEKVADVIEQMIGQRPYIDFTGGGCYTVGMSLTEGHYPKQDREPHPWVCFANYGLNNDGTVMFEDMGYATFGVFMSGDGSYCGDIYNTDGLDFGSDQYRVWDEWHDRMRALTETKKDAMWADEFIPYVVSVWETWKRERHSAPEGVITGLEVTA